MKKVILSTTCIVVVFLSFAGGFSVGKGPRLLSMILTGGGAAKAEWQRLESVESFNTLYGSIGDMRDMVLAEAKTEREVALGMRWILRNIAMSTDIVADGNVIRPNFVRMDSEARKIGGDNPDAEYHLAKIDGSYAYRITGNRGSVRYFSLNVNAGKGMEKRRLAAFLNDRTIEFDELGNFELLLSDTKPEQPGQWLEIPKNSTAIMLRQYIADREKENLVDINIEVLGEAPPIQASSDEDIAESLTATNYAFIMLGSLHKIVLPESWENPNKFYNIDSDTMGGAISGPDNLYMIGSFKVAADEALIVEVDPPATRYWNIALETIWHETVDYLHRPASRTLENVVPSADGKVRFVIAHQNPNVNNWLDPMGNERGQMTFRWLEARGIEVSKPRVTLVKLTDLESVTL